MINILYPFKVPDPVVFFPLNAAYGTKEINNLAVKGIPRGVTLAPGPDGRPNYSYKFSGSSNSYIEFPNRIGGPLDVRYSMTILCWVYYDGKGGPLFNYEKLGSTFGVHFWVTRSGALFVLFNKRDYSSTKHCQCTPASRVDGSLLVLLTTVVLAKPNCGPMEPWFRR